jgi:hypothetical protein
MGVPKDQAVSTFGGLGVRVPRIPWWKSQDIIACNRKCQSSLETDCGAMVSFGLGTDGTKSITEDSGYIYPQLVFARFSSL